MPNFEKDLFLLLIILADFSISIELSSAKRYIFWSWKKKLFKLRLKMFLRGPGCVMKCCPSAGILIDEGEPHACPHFNRQKKLERPKLYVWGK